MDILDIVKHMEQSGAVDTDAALKAVNHAYKDGVINREEAELLLEVNALLERADVVDGDWEQRFVEVMKDHLLTFGDDANGYITDEESGWLIAQLGRSADGITAGEIDMLIYVLRYAASAPTELGRFAVKSACDRIIKVGKAVPEDVERVRLSIFSAAGEGGNWVSAYEAECLFQVNDAIARSANCKTWSELFARAIANHVMARSHPDPMSHSDALAREAWLAETKNSAAHFLGSLASSFGKGWFESVSYDENKAMAATVAAKEAMDRAAEQVDAAETEWLLKRISRDSSVSPAERALIEFLKDEAPGFVEGLNTAAA